MRLVTLLLTLSAAPAFAQGMGPCSFPLDTTQASPPVLRSLAGVYELEWHSRDQGAAHRSPRERLWLWPTAPTDSSLDHPAARPAPDDTLRYPLFGTEAPLATAASAGDSLRAAIDPVDPPVLLMVGRGPTPPILLFGTVATRRAGVVALDGAGIGVWLTHVSPRTFAGTFRAWGIVQEDSGYLCARRLH
jgi:hypothetical protein